MLASRALHVAFVAVSLSLQATADVNASAKCANKPPERPALSQGHLLVQLSSGVQLAKKKSQDLVNSSTSDWGQSECNLDVRRRRRNSAMCSCRRRSGASNLQPGYMCKGNKITSCGSNCPIGWPETSGQPMIAEGAWCQIRVPENTWHLKTCPEAQGSVIVKVLTYNLYWWNLFGKRKGNHESAGHLIADTSGPEQYDIMAFQECDDRDRILRDAKHQGLQGEYETVDGGHAIALAFRKSRFQLLEHGSEEVGEDSKAQYYGRRSAQWVRLLHRDGIVVFFVNHHGPLRVSEDGGCTGSSVALNIMQVIAGNAHPDDRIVLVGDFNAEPWSSRISELDKRLHRVSSGTRMGGVDHVYTNCKRSVVNKTNLGTGGSDHDALSVVFEF